MTSKLYEITIVHLPSSHLPSFSVTASVHASIKSLARLAQDRTLLWVNLMLAVLEDVPMVCLTLAYTLQLQDVQTIPLLWMVSMMVCKLYELLFSFVDACIHADVGWRDLL